MNLKSFSHLFVRAQDVFAFHNMIRYNMLQFNMIQVYYQFIKVEIALLRHLFRLHNCLD